MHIAVEGCCHGELNKIYETLEFIEKKENLHIDLLLCCGDFQAVRNERDLMCMAVPDKHKSMQDFWEYYSGKKAAPYLTVFIGGNHEASNYLQELPYGGWAAPNIYFLGYASVISYKGVRIGGLSGIFKQHDYTKGHYEKPPYSSQSLRSVYHIRHLEVFKLKQLKQPVDIMMSHDWPNGVVEHGDKNTLLRKKRHFQEDVSKHQLGSLPAWSVLKQLRPKYWFSGHLHVKFAAMIEHELNEEQLNNSLNKNKETRFLALDKCLPRRDFLQVLEIDSPNDGPAELCYDAEWLAVLKKTNELLSTSYRSYLLPTEGLSDKTDYSVNEEDVDQILKLFDNNLRIPLNFHKDDSCLFDPEHSAFNQTIEVKINPQTTELCEKLSIDDPIVLLINSESTSGDVSFNASSWMSEEDSHVISNVSINPEEISLDDDSDDNGDKDEKNDVDEKDKNEAVMSISMTDDNHDDDKDDKLDASEKNSSSTNHSRPRGRLAANFSMKLPPPKCSTPLPSAAASEERSSNEEFSASFSLPEYDESAEKDNQATDEGNVDPEPVVKKFKRRNASLYVDSLQDDEKT